MGSYTLRIITGSQDIGPGMVICLDGEWDVGVMLVPGGSAMLFQLVTAIGHGKLGVLEPPATVVAVDTKYTRKPWGQELEVCPFGQLKIIEVDAGHRTSKQLHRSKHETLVPLSGSGHREPAGLQHEIIPGTPHRVVGPLRLLEGSSYHPDDVVRLADDYGREIDD